MADVDGTWNIAIKSPTGEQKAVLVVNSAGESFTGSFTGDEGTLEIPDGKVDGGTIRWDMNITKPMPLTLNSELSVDGDALNGTVKVGAFGSFPMNGTRA